MAQGEDERRYSISEVSEMIHVPIHLLRRWEERFPQLRPRRTRTNRRYYLQTDIAIVRRIKQLLQHEKMTTEGARKALDEELRGERRPRTRQEAIDLVDAIEKEVRRMLDLLEAE